MRPPEFEELHAKMIAEARKGFCMHPDAPHSCSDKIVKAHTVQKNGGLSAIAEQGHVLSLKDAFHALGENDGKLIPKLTGINNASTFMGFCSAHDSSMFRAAEHDLNELTHEAAFVLAYRAMAYEAFAKDVAARWAPIQRQADAGQPFERQAQIQMMFHWTLQGTKLALQDFAKAKSLFDTASKTKDYSQFFYFAIEFDEVLPILTCGGFAPEFDFRGNRQQYMGIPDLEHIYLNWTVIKGRSIVIFSWLGNQKGYARSFVDSFQELAEGALADAILRLVFEYVENTYIQPSWWNNLGESVQNQLTAKMKNGTLSGDRTGAGLLSDGLNLFSTLSPVAQYSKFEA